MTAYLTFIHAISSLHAGTGQGSGIIDLPIAREKATGLPYLPGSSLKGALRTSCGKEVEVSGPGESKKTVSCAQLFGSEETDTSATAAGTIQISDQRLLLLPVRSLAGTFAWVTSPYVLHRLVRDMADLHLEKIEVPRITDTSQAYVVTDDVDSCQLFANEGKDRIYLEELDLYPAQNAAIRQWADWLGRQIFPNETETELQSLLHERLCVVHDDVFSFLLKTATEIIARIRLEEDSKTVKKGGLWYEEALPTETVLSGLALTTPRAKSTRGTKNGNAHEELSAAQIGAAFKQLAQKNLQLGGKSTVGHGQCRVLIVDERSV
jgi:CRISPR-associated protein Cmr4